MRICIITAEDESIFLKRGLLFLNQNIKNLDFISVPGFFKLKKIIYYIVLLQPIELFCLIKLKIKNIFIKNNIKKIKFTNVNSKDFFFFLKRKKYDLLVSYSCPQIFKKKLLFELQRMKTGIVNFHPALLPKYKGLFGCYYSLKNKEKYVGITFHNINEEIDGGRIISRLRIKINKKDTVFNLLTKIFLSDESLNFVAKCILKYKKITYKKKLLHSRYAYNSVPKFLDLIKFKFKLLK
jgi:folate-dependent phosphoribosylglycinamide formyltransferase PurN